MKKYIAALAAVLALAACEGTEPPSQGPKYEQVREVKVKLSDGRVMECIRWGESRGSLDCNWAGATKQ